MLQHYLGLDQEKEGSMKKDPSNVQMVDDFGSLDGISTHFPNTLLILSHRSNFSKTVTPRMQA